MAYTKDSGAYGTYKPNTYKPPTTGVGIGAAAGAAAALPKTPTPPKSTTAPKTVSSPSTYTPPPKQPERDIASEIKAEMSKGTIDWGKVGQLTQERDAKIKASGVQTQSTTDYINDLYTQRLNTATKPGGTTTDIGANGMQYQPTAGVPREEQAYVYNPYYDSQYYIDLVKNQFNYDNASDIAAIRQAYNQGRGELQGQLPGIEQNAKGALDSNDAYYYTQAAPELRAAMEQSGLYRGGDMLGRNVELLAMRGQNANNINQDKVNQINAVNQALARLNSEEPLKIAEVEAANNAAQAQALLQAANMGVQNQLALAGYTGNILGGDTMQKIAQSYNQAMGYADRTGVMPDGTKTLPNRQFEADEAYRNKTFEENVRQFNLNYGLDLKQMSLQEAQQRIENAYRNNQISLARRDQALAESRFIEEQKQNTFNRQQSELNRQSGGSSTIESYIKKGQDMMMEGAFDEAKGVYVQKYTPDQIRQWIASQNLTREQTIELAQRLGVYVP